MQKKKKKINKINLKIIIFFFIVKFNSKWIKISKNFFIFLIVFWINKKKKKL